MQKNKLSERAWNSSIWSSSRILLFLVVAAIFAGGLGLRMLDLTDPPLDFHPSRQLFAYTNARGMYYQLNPSADPQIRERAIAAWKSTDQYEPRFFEGLVAVSYLIVGGEYFWVARLLASIFWLIGGWFLFLLAKRATNGDGALLAVAYYLFLPFSIIASRSFQPDVLMIMLLMITAYCLYRWSEENTWKWALTAGIFGGLTILSKAQGVFAVAGMAFFVTMMGKGLKRALSNWQVWVMGLLMIGIPASYYLGPYRSSAVGYFSNFTIAMSRLLKDPGFFVRWANFIHTLIDFAAVVLGLIGTLLMPKKGKAIAIGLWVGYFMLGLFFPWQIPTHDYYSLPLIPTVAFGLAPIGACLFHAIRKQSKLWRWAFVVVCLAAIAYPSWLARSGLFGKDYRNEPGAWRKMGEELPRDGSIIALTHDYGFRLLYWGYTPVTLWPYQADFQLHLARGGNLSPDIRPYFDDMTRGKRYFLVTAYNEFDAQHQVKEILTTEYPLVQRGDGYMLFGLSQSKID